MSNSPSVKVSHVGKRYRLGGLEPYRTLRDKIMNIARGQNGDARQEQIWALKDVSFEVKQGEVLGIIGRNGAGKSTLLKLLSRITTPDTGSIELEGRVGALLEVGTGFHPELSGRENIYMNGAILGMSRRDIDRKFDEIVAFSGVESFLDTPVKRYSSGMRVRLGFAVAAHLEPEILVIDEVLAVGDAEFQRKCLGRMNQVATEGRTVLFVSHQMEAVQSLCSRAIWLDQGGVVEEGFPDVVIPNYLTRSMSKVSTVDLAKRSDRTGDGLFQVCSIKIDDGFGRALRTGSPARFIVSIDSKKAVHNIAHAAMRLVVRDKMDRIVTSLGNEVTGQEIVLQEGRTQAVCHLEKLPLVPGSYLLDFAVRTNGTLHDKLFCAATFDILAGDFHGVGKGEHLGLFHLEQQWTLK